MVPVNVVARSLERIFRIELMHISINVCARSALFSTLSVMTELTEFEKVDELLN
jgi:hypothetical protein